MWIKLAKVVLIGVTSILVSCGGGPSDADIPAPQVWRTDLYYGYYGGSDQVLEALGHTNLVFESGLFGGVAQLRVIEAAKQPTILDISSEVYVGELGTDRRISPILESNLRARFSELRSHNVLKYIIGLYPIDEPDNTVVHASIIREANFRIRAVASEFEELKNVKLAVIYANAYGLPGIETYDWVGFDNYENVSAIFTDGEYANLVKNIRPDQRTLIVPGGAFGQDITPFLNFAETHTEVLAIIPFLWFDNWEGTNKGIRSNGMAPSYCEAGLKVSFPKEIKTCLKG